MPVYEYECRQCGYRFEYLVLHSSPVAECPACRRKDLNRLISLCSVSSENTKQANLRLHVQLLAASATLPPASSSASPDLVLQLPLVDLAVERPLADAQHPGRLLTVAFRQRQRLLDVVALHLDQRPAHQRPGRCAPPSRICWITSLSSSRPGRSRRRVLHHELSMKLRSSRTLPGQS